MPNVDALFNQILGELTQNRDNATQALLGCVHSLVDVLPIAATLRPIQDYKLLQGLLFAQSELQFFNRLIVEAEQKQSLAKYCLSECELDAQVRHFLDNERPTLRRFFFESGSTIAHPIGMFADRLSKAQQKRKSSASEDKSLPTLDSTVVTNNLTAVTALAGLVGNLEPVQGRLSMKYFGFLPFAEDDALSNWQVEGKRFNLLADDVESCEAVFATCSNFSLVAGPIVGGRDNCLTKRAMYAGAERWGEDVARQFYVLFHFQKLVPVVDTYRLSVEFENPQPTCGCVFAPPSIGIGQAITKWKNRHDEDSPISSEVFDGSWHDQLRDLAVNGRRPSHNSIRIPVERFDEATSADRVRVPHKLRTSWVEWIQSSIGLNILISLPQPIATSAFECVRDEVKRVNEIFSIADCGIEFTIRNEDKAANDCVVHIVANR